MVKFIPALFSSLMVPAILDGTKTKTRRVVTMPKDDIKEATWGYTAFTPDRHISFRAKHASGEYGESFVKCPYGKKGDILWVRESYYQYGKWVIDEGVTKIRKRIKYKFVPLDEDVMFEDSVKALGELFKLDIRPNSYMLPAWYKRLGRFMPKKYSRIFLEIESIRVERLHDISPGDACNEGIEYYNVDLDAFKGGELQSDFVNYMWRDDEDYEDYDFPHYADCCLSFFSLWEKINGKESLDANPFVWVVTFKKINKPSNFN